MQVVIYDEEMARPLRSEFVIQVVGEVRLRPDGNENEHLATGKIEVVAESIEVLAKSDALPFQVSTALENESENKLPGEDVRLKYRYLDLRRPSMQRNLKLRAQMSKAARHALEEMGFEEIETPTMIKSTPEGAVTSSCRPVWCRVLVRSAAVPAVAQAAAHGLRRRALLPAGPLLS